MPCSRRAALRLERCDVTYGDAAASELDDALVGEALEHLVDRRAGAPDEVGELLLGERDALPAVLGVRASELQQGAVETAVEREVHRLQQPAAQLLDPLGEQVDEQPLHRGVPL